MQQRRNLYCILEYKDESNLRMLIKAIIGYFGLLAIGIMDPYCELHISVVYAVL